MRLLVASSLAASSIAVAQPAGPGARAAAEIEASKKAFVSALASGSAETLAAQLADKLDIRGLWFPSENCRKSFGSRMQVKKADAVAFATCLLELKLQQGSYAFVHEPGSRVYPRWYKGLVFEIHGDEIDPSSPSIDNETLQKHAKTKLAVKRDTATAALMKKDKNAVVTATVRMCIDAKGKVDALAVTADAAHESYRGTVEKAAKKWTFKPFKRAGKPMRVCATHELVEYDGDDLLGGVEGGAANVPVPPVPPPVKR